MARFIAGMKVDNVTCTEYTSGVSCSNPKMPRSLVSDRFRSFSYLLKRRTVAPIWGTPAESRTIPAMLPDSLIGGAANATALVIASAAVAIRNVALPLNMPKLGSG